MSIWLYILLQFTVVAYAFVGGVFLAFSDFIMRSLARTSGSGGVEAMQNINREVFRWVFMALFLGLAPISLFITGFGLFYYDGDARALMASAGLVYLVACFGSTIAFNVPMNESLAEMDRSANETRDFWYDTYLPRWTFWNGVRTIACAVSAFLLLMGLLMTLQAK